MDQFASNTLRTLGIVVTSIFVIFASLALLLLALCFGMLGSLGGSGHRDPQTIPILFGLMAVAALIITLGVITIAKLAKGIIRESAVPPLRWNAPTAPAGTTLQACPERSQGTIRPSPARLLFPLRPPHLRRRLLQPLLLFQLLLLTQPSSPAPLSTSSLIFRPPAAPPSSASSSPSSRKSPPRSYP